MKNVTQIVRGYTCWKVRCRSVTRIVAAEYMFKFMQKKEKFPRAELRVTVFGMITV